MGDSSSSSSRAGRRSGSGSGGGLWGRLTNGGSSHQPMQPPSIMPTEGSSSSVFYSTVGSSSSRQQQGAGSAAFFTPTNNHHSTTTMGTSTGGFSYFPSESDDGSVPPVRLVSEVSSPPTTDDEDNTTPSKERISLQRLTKKGAASSSAGDGGVVMMGGQGGSGGGYNDHHTAKGCVACFGSGGFSPLRSFRKGLRRRWQQQQQQSLLDLPQQQQHHGSSSTPLHAPQHQQPGAAGVGGRGRQSTTTMTVLSHRSSGSDSNSEFWDAVEMLDDTGLDYDHEGDGGGLGPGEGGGGGVIRVELLSRKYDIQVSGLQQQHGASFSSNASSSVSSSSSSQLIPVSFILTETLRRYAGIRVFHDDGGSSPPRHNKGGTGGGETPSSSAYNSNSSSHNGGASSSEQQQQQVEVHRLIPACKGLINKRTGEQFGMESQLTFEALLGDTYAVIVVPTTTTKGSSSSNLSAATMATGQPPPSSSSSSSLLLQQQQFLSCGGGGEEGGSTGASLQQQRGMLMAGGAGGDDEDEGGEEGGGNNNQMLSSYGTMFSSNTSSQSGGSPLRGVSKAVFPSTAVPRYPGLDGDGGNCWSQPDATEFSVRGLHYMSDKVKVPSEQAPYNLLGVDLLLSDTKRSHVSKEPHSFVSRARRPPSSSKSFLMVMNFSLPWGSFIAYFGPAHEGSSPYVGDVKLDSLLKRFLEGSDDFRNQRLKVIPRCVEGPWPVKAAVGTTPAIMGTKIQHTYYRQDKNTFEIEVDISSSVAAQYILSVVKSFTQIVSVDLAFVLQGEDESELPERILFAVRFHHLNVAKAPTYLHWEQTILQEGEAEGEEGGGRLLPPPPTASTTTAV